MMMTLSQVCGCVKRLHPDLRQRVKDDTFLKYQKAFNAFTDYLQRQYDLVLTSPEDLDLLLMEYRTEADLTRAQHVLLVASAEFFLPHVKGKLLVSREALRGRATAEPVKHTVPLTWECALSSRPSFHPSQTSVETGSMARTLWKPIGSGEWVQRLARGRGILRRRGDTRNSIFD